MAHQSADPAVAVVERVDEVHPVVTGGHAEDLRQLAVHPVLAEPGVEMGHERGDLVMRWRHMVADLDIAVAPLARDHDDAAGAVSGPLPDHQRAAVDIAVELTMQPADEVRRGRILKHARGRPPVDLGLEPDMGGALLLQRAPPRILVESTGQSRLDLPRPGVVALDPVRVVAVHHSDHRRDLGQRRRRQASAKTGGGLGKSESRLGQSQVDLAFDPGWLDPCRSDDHGRVSPGSLPAATGSARATLLQQDLFCDT